MKNEKQRKTAIVICCVILAVLLLILGLQIRKMGVEVTAFFDEHGLPTLLFDLCGVLFGVVLLVMGRFIRDDNTSLKKLCKVIGILEIVCAVIYFAMSQVLLIALNNP